MDKAFLSLFSFDITPYTGEVKYSKGDVISKLGDDGGKLVCILRRETKCSYICPGGELTALDYAPSPAFYAELELLGVQKYTSLVEAVTDTEACVIDTEKVKDRLLSDTLFLRNLLSCVASKLLRVNMQMASWGSFPLKRRLSSCILCHEEGGLHDESHGECKVSLCQLPPQCLE